MNCPIYDENHTYLAHKKENYKYLGSFWIAQAWLHKNLNLKWRTEQTEPTDLVFLPNDAVIYIS